MSAIHYSHATKTWLRITSGILALAAMTLVVLRATLLVRHGAAADGGMAVLDILRLVFPLSLSLLFGYVAWNGMFPFNNKHNL